MAKTKTEKAKILEELREKIKKSQTILFLDYAGLDSEALFKLRQKIKQMKKYFKVVKKTIAQLAFDKEEKKVKVKELEGQLALVFGEKEDIALLKVVSEFAKENQNLKILGGLMGEEILDKEQIEFLASLPTKEELLSRALNVLSAPISNFVFLLSATLNNFLLLLSQIKGQKEK